MPLALRWNYSFTAKTLKLHGYNVTECFAMKKPNLEKQKLTKLTKGILVTDDTPYGVGTHVFKNLPLPHRVAC